MDETRSLTGCAEEQNGDMSINIPTGAGKPGHFQSLFVCLTQNIRVQLRNQEEPERGPFCFPPPAPRRFLRGSPAKRNKTISRTLRRGNSPHIHSLKTAASSF